MWRENHPYLLADRIEDLTEPALKDQEPKCDREVALYGFVRGSNLNATNEVHLPGVGDFTPSEISVLPDPCPLPKTIKKRSLNQKERVLYAPLTGYGDLFIDKDAVYLNLDSNQINERREGDEYLDTLRMPNENKSTEQLTLIQGGSSIRRGTEDLAELNESNEEMEEGSEDDSGEELGEREAASDSDNGSDVEMEDSEDDEMIEQMENELEGDLHEKAAEKYRSRAASKLNLKQLVYGDASQALKSEDQLRVKFNIKMDFSKVSAFSFSAHHFLPFVLFFQISIISFYVFISYSFDKIFKL